MRNLFLYVCFFSVYYVNGGYYCIQKICVLYFCCIFRCLFLVCCGFSVVVCLRFGFSELNCCSLFLCMFWL